MARSITKITTLEHRGTIFNPSMLLGHGTAHVVQAQQLFRGHIILHFLHPAARRRPAGGRR